jgi:hypothetical protein
MICTMVLHFLDLDLVSGKKMKTMYLAIIVIVTIFIFSNILSIGAQCYGCGKNDSALQQALLEKQTEVLQQQNKQLDQDSQIITLLIGVSISLGCVIVIVTWIFLKNKKIVKK